MNKDLRLKIENYIPFNEQEEKDKEQFLEFIDTFSDVLTRKNVIGHFSASAFVVNKNRTKMLVVYHNIYDGLIYPGGHVDGETDFLKVALREVLEETGIKAQALSNEMFALQSLPVKGHIKHGKYVSSHTHLDIIYLMEADDSLPLTRKEDENKLVKWIDFEDAMNDEVVDYIRPINQKLISKLKNYNL